ncbi:MAG: IS200/IS605 family transposase [Tannerella sp.]|jgi:putative transposase|nr:IS200/IS605 family transposase [Tannerella sp.]
MENRTGSHSIHSLQVHLVWITEYRCQVLTGDVQYRCRDILRQLCNTLDIRILKGAVGKGHIRLHLSCLPGISPGETVKRLKGRSSRLLLQEFPELRRRCRGSHFWGTGYGSWSVGNITDGLLQNYLNRHKDSPNGTENFILE